MSQKTPLDTSLAPPFSHPNPLVANLYQTGNPAGLCASSDLASLTSHSHNRTAERIQCDTACQEDKGTTCRILSRGRQVEYNSEGSPSPMSSASPMDCPQNVALEQPKRPPTGHIEPLAHTARASLPELEITMNRTKPLPDVRKTSPPSAQRPDGSGLALRWKCGDPIQLSQALLESELGRGHGRNIANMWCICAAFLPRRMYLPGDC